ncbi:MAG: A/G-specific adenine glycosylase [Rubrivivax sp.]|nr:A/G-specific adenine glycosylase [Rubrivivax sp.]
MKPAPTQPSLASRVIRWQRQHGRHHLPWQGTRDPYRVWLSEIMLQQTQVSTVLGYYERFLQRFPDVKALAAAPLDEVLAAWAGLGYYSRARNLHRCAQAVVTQHDGRFPPHAAGLQALPGIGRSTAAAISAFCHGERVAILDGNVKRVLARVLRFEGDLSQAAALAALWQEAEALLPERDIEAYTQGLMDLGATVCHRSRPDCEHCPLAAVCGSYATQDQAAYPVKTRKLRRGERFHALLWLRRGDRVWLVQRPDKGVWAGLWSLPEWDDPQVLAERVAAWPGQGELLPVIEHALTHFDWRLQPLRWTLPSRTGRTALTAIEAGLPAGQWVDGTRLKELGLPAPIKRLLLAQPA